MRTLLFLLSFSVLALDSRGENMLETVAPTQTRLSLSPGAPPDSVSPTVPDTLEIAPSQTRLLVAEAGGGGKAAIASQAVATQPSAPSRPQAALPPKASAPDQPDPGTVQIAVQVLDPRLDPDRPRNSQLDISEEQTLSCGGIPVVLPAGTYDQKVIVENPEGRRAIQETPLKAQQIGLGYIRYLSDVPLKINGVDRPGGLDVPVRKEDNLPVRVWYKKMTEPDDLTKAFSFIFPPVALAAGAGAWSSSNVLLPDSPPKFSEARDYYLKPLKPKPNPNDIPQPSHVRPLRDPYASSSNQIRSK